MLLQLKEGYDFEMVYFNADGGESTMCGNGGRCLVNFAKKIGVIDTHTKFIAIDGEHEAIILPDNRVKLKMQNVNNVETGKNYVLLNTGSPHYVCFQSNIYNLNVFEEGRKIRYNERFANEGVNVNFVETLDDTLFVRTYERGVENETLSCGTGVTAAALAASTNHSGEFQTTIVTPGGKLQVQFSKLDAHTFKNVYLIGPAEFVFNGTITI
jgi:diaminopimelate epimerase